MFVAQIWLFSLCILLKHGIGRQTQSVTNPTELAEVFNHHFATMRRHKTCQWNSRLPQMKGSNFTQQLQIKFFRFSIH